MLYTIYKTTNTINNKEYIGFHGIKNLENLIHEKSENGSIFEDGYMGSGKLIKRALEKYGPHNMYQELIFISENKEEAEEIEKHLVNRKWVESNDNYNLSIGGGVTILFGESNGFYGKKHSAKTIERIQETRNKTLLNNPFSWSVCYLKNNHNIKFFNKYDIYAYFNVNNWQSIAMLVKNDVIEYKSFHLQKSILNRLEKYIAHEHGKPERLEEKRKITSKRFKGIPKTEESNIKRGQSIKKWIKENPEAHKQRMLKINTNQEKINKTTEKHKGMKRSKTTRLNISNSLKGKTPKNAGKIYILNYETTERKMIDKNDNIPEGWIRGFKFKD